MKTYKSSELKKFDKRPGMLGIFTHAKDLTMAHWTFEKDAVLAAHSHPHAQITYVVSGKVQFDREDGGAYVLDPGDFIVFEPDETHGGVSLEKSVVLDAFSPARDDFK